MWLRITKEDASIHEFIDFDDAFRVIIDPKEGVRVHWRSDKESEFYSGYAGEVISRAVEQIAKVDADQLMSTEPEKGINEDDFRLIVPQDVAERYEDDE